MFEFIESKLLFKFNKNKWDKVILFDKHADYKKIKEKLEGSKGVDFIAIADNRICFIEVKNFKKHRIENKKRLLEDGNTLMTEIAQKIRDSLACVIAANRNSTHDKFFWRKVVQILSNTNKRIDVILWLEEDKERVNTDERKKGKINTYRRTLKSKLKWLISTNADVHVLNSTNKIHDKFHFSVENK